MVEPDPTSFDADVESTTNVDQNPLLLSLTPADELRGTEVVAPDDTVLAPLTSSFLPEEDPLIGRVLHGVRLIELIGSGASSKVYRGLHQMLKLEYAVKVLLEKKLGSVAAQRMVREAQILSRLKHENLVNVADCGLTEEGAPFITMELLRGSTLWDLMKQDGRIGVRRTIGLARQIASGVAEIHRHGFVHRDLKPSNVMLYGTPPVVKLLDFGTARPQADDAPALTRAKAFIGTPRYTPPEQIRSPSSAGPASDVYSLGVIVFEMIAGRSPYDGDMTALIAQHLDAPVPAIPEAGPLEATIRSMLSKDPAQRPSLASLIETFDEVERRLMSAPITAPKPVRPASDPPPPASKSRPSVAQAVFPWQWILLAVVLLVCTGLLVGLSIRPEFPEIVVIGPSTENAPKPAAKAAPAAEPTPDAPPSRLRGK